MRQPPSGLEITPRLVAPAALGVFAVVLLIVVVTSLGGDGGGESRSPAAGERQEQPRRAARTRRTQDFSRRRSYSVRSGDTLASIAQRTGVEIERLLELNPSVDPQGLVTGQRIKLRE
jgi:hypothetical protein